MGQLLRVVMLNKKEIINLKITAEDDEDLKVFSAYLQDSVIVVNDIKYLSKNRKFICIFNRFMWEDAERGIFRENRRIRSALVFNEVSSVKSKGINPKIKEKILEFLTIKFENHKESGVVKLIFSGGAIIKIEIDNILSTLEDFGKPWKTNYKPKHKILNENI